MQSVPAGSLGRFPLWKIVRCDQLETLSQCALFFDPRDKTDWPHMHCGFHATLLLNKSQRTPSMPDQCVTIISLCGLISGERNLLEPLNLRLRNGWLLLLPLWAKPRFSGGISPETSLDELQIQTLPDMEISWETCRCCLCRLRIVFSGRIECTFATPGKASPQDYTI
ncbi:hypothetical protein K432DRAFT_121665 [Lepidopterella palustris CBS 459.81]|uniref:Uncharacterized protein n=1 Tax=Lepidopterella palustris CBS 459.81 TaxID=1314670 RepID=A0A8E2EII5_9PEZI|nr:hypothetical protein K432DRAFT_121665 [Lepidopterella palustris CBS 459.81]